MLAGVSGSHKPFYREANVQVSEGPMVLGIQLEGEEGMVRTMCGRLPEMARSLLAEVASFYPLLRLKGCELVVKARWPSVVQRMVLAVQRVNAETLTPMAAVAGAISDEIMGRILECSDSSIRRILVNNGGDMAIFSPYLPVRVGIRVPGRPGHVVELPERQEPYGVATSGWMGRSFSLGIADAVTVIAPYGAIADAAATHVANHVSLDGLRVVSRERAGFLDPDSDIPDEWVTVLCGALAEDERHQALMNGMHVAGTLFEAGVIEGVVACLQGEVLRKGCQVKPMKQLIRI